MRPIVKIFIVAVVLLILKAFLLDDYIAQHYGNDANATAENNLSAQASETPPPQVQPAPQPLTPPTEKIAPKESNVSTQSLEKQENKTDSEDKKMPLDRLGDKISEHIKL